MATVRLATTEDVDALIRLRAVMFDSLRDRDEREVWEPACRRTLTAGLEEGQLIAAIAEIGGVTVGAGVAGIWQWIPSPRTPGGRRAYIGSTVTEPAEGNKGHATAILTLLLGELHERGVEEVELHAATGAEDLYRRVGFSCDTGGVAMRLVWE